MGKKLLPVMKNMCASCPYRPDSTCAHLRLMSAMESLSAATIICHSTGGANAVHPQGTGKPPRLCRGARNLQMNLFYHLGFIEAPTDEAWVAKAKTMGFKT